MLCFVEFLDNLLLEYFAIGINCTKKMQAIYT